MRFFHPVILAAKLKPRKFWVLGVLPFLVVPAGMTMQGASHASAAIAALLADPLSVFSSRSPGGRPVGTLAQTKSSFAVTGSPVGSVPALAAGGGGFGDVSALPPAVPGAGQPAGSPLLSSDNGVFSGPSLFGGGPDVAGVYPVPFGYGEIGSPPGDYIGSPPGGAVVVPPPTPSTVPEPQSWVVMLAGLLITGAALRLRHRGVGRSADAHIGAGPTSAAV